MSSRSNRFSIEQVENYSFSLEFQCFLENSNDIWQDVQAKNWTLGRGLLAFITNQITANGW